MSSAVRIIIAAVVAAAGLTSHTVSSSAGPADAGDTPVG